MMATTARFRYDNWKTCTFMEQRFKGTMAGPGQTVHPTAVAKLFNLRTDPYDIPNITSNTYYNWSLHTTISSMGQLRSL